MPGEETAKTENYSVGTKGPLIGMGHGDCCLKLEPQAWLSTVRNSSTNHSHASLFLSQAWAFKGVNLLILHL